MTAFATGPPTISKSVQAAQAYEKSKFDKEGSLWWRCKSFPVYRCAGVMMVHIKVVDYLRECLVELQDQEAKERLVSVSDKSNSCPF